MRFWFSPATHPEKGIRSKDGKYTLMSQSTVPAPAVPVIQDKLINHGHDWGISRFGHHHLLAMATDNKGKTKVAIDRFEDELSLGDRSGAVMSTCSIGCLILGVFFTVILSWTSLQALVSIALGIAGCTMRWTVGKWSPRRFILSRPLHCDRIPAKCILVTLLYGLEICCFGIVSTKLLSVLLKISYEILTPSLYALSSDDHDRALLWFVIALVSCLAIQPERILYTLTFKPKTEPDVGKQPYEGMGIQGFLDRINLGIEEVKNLLQVLEKRRIGRVSVGSIENYIERDVDFAIVGFYHLWDRKLSASVSSGVPTQREFLEKAKSRGFKDEKDEHGGKGPKKKGNCTYGTIIEELFGIDGKNWHQDVCGVSRYVLLSEAFIRVYIGLA